MEHMKPNEYWQLDECHLDRKFYAAFCILASACSDYAVGVKLKDENRLNWACTMLYYSLVHALRLICFIEMGDFPTEHRELSKVFSEDRAGGRTWIREIERDHQFFSSEGIQVELVREFRLTVLLPERRKYWGQILDEARKLRNDANYEGLLISHEYSHAIVTDCFRRLASALQKASEELLPEVVPVFKDFVDHSPRKDYWYAFLNWKSGHVQSGSVSQQLGEGLYYLKASLKYRHADRQSISNVFAWLERLCRAPDFAAPCAEEVHNNIVMRSFGLKNMLMFQFKRKIEEFENSFKNIPILE